MDGDAQDWQWRSDGRGRRGKRVYRSDTLDVYQYEVADRFLLNDDIHSTPKGTRVVLLVGRARPSGRIVAIHLYRESKRHSLDAVHQVLRRLGHQGAPDARIDELVAQRNTMALLRRVAGGNE